MKKIIIFILINICLFSCSDESNIDTSGRVYCKVGNVEFLTETEYTYSLFSNAEIRRLSVFGGEPQLLIDSDSSHYTSVITIHLPEDSYLQDFIGHDISLNSDYNPPYVSGLITTIYDAPNLKILKFSTLNLKIKGVENNTINATFNGEVYNTQDLNETYTITNGKIDHVRIENPNEWQ